MMQVEPAADPSAVEPVTDVTPAAPSPAPVAEPEITDKAQKRFDHLTWKVRELERQLAARAMPEPEAEKPPAKAPVAADYEFDEAKLETARAAWLKSETDRIVTERLAQAEQEREAKAQTETFRQREAEFEKTHPEYREKVYGEVAISTPMAAIIAESKDGPALAFYLAEHPQIAQAIYDLPERAAALEMGAILAQLKAPAPVVVPIVPKVPQVSQAPPPAPKIDAVEPAVAKSPNDMSDSEFSKWRHKYMTK